LQATLNITARIERWPVAGAFIIARGAKTHVDVVVVEVSDGTHIGCGEATPIYYKGETAQSAVAAVESLGRNIDREAIQSLLPAGAARNALDYAFWNLAAQQQGKPVWQLAGLLPPQPLPTAMTVSLGTPEKMETDARTLAGQFGLLKLKLSGEGDVERVEAVRRGAPNARLIVDANESWTGRDVAAEAAALIPYGVELIEQPVKAGEDHLLDGVSPPIPLAADETCQDRADLARCKGRYGVINIKLDKAGGLTEALALKAEAQAMGFDIMVGCMLSTSLGLAPAFLVAQGAKWVDLDGALLLAKDRKGGFKVEGGVIMPPSNLI
jgi:L-alanine-DL-glutamate epimerase-like enolase superfamily enzyme